MGHMIKSDGSEGNWDLFRLAELQKAVGGYVEVIKLPNNKVMLVNEEGKIRNLPINEKATMFVKAEMQGAFSDDIRGDVIVCNVGDIE